MACSCMEDGAKRGARALVEKTARLIHAHLSHGCHNPALLLAFGNRIVEESALLGGPLAEMAAEFGEKLCAEGLRRLTKTTTSAQ